jgi:hypothetical protein
MFLIRTALADDPEGYPFSIESADPAYLCNKCLERLHRVVAATPG